MRESTNKVINDLIERTEQMIVEVQEFKNLAREELNQKPSAEKWSVLECIAHVNLYGTFYLKEFEQQIVNSKYTSEPNFKSGWMGNYSANSMLPKGEKIPMKMKTFKHMNPIFSKVEEGEIELFILQQKEFVNLLKKAREVSLTKTKCKLTIPLLRFNLGDTLRFYAYHNIRHLLQAQNVLKIIRS